MFFKVFAKIILAIIKINFFNAAEKILVDLLCDSLKLRLNVLVTGGFLYVVRSEEGYGKDFSELESNFMQKANDMYTLDERVVGSGMGLFLILGHWTKIWPQNSNGPAKCVYCENLQNIYRKPISKIMVFKNFSSFHLMIQAPLTEEFNYSTNGHKLKSLTNMQDCCMQGNIRGPPCYQEKGWESDEMLVPREFTEWKWESTVNCQIFHLCLPTVID
jgi:hypothetical protein